MPVNAPREYYVAEEHFHKAKSKEEKIAALEEMLRLMPRHHGSENALAQLKARLAKMKKGSDKKG
ncbi:MAG TPA: GTP-binding protein, partial [archaeon]|nr:GTP-binding protein [archaeon]